MNVTHWTDYWIIPQQIRSITEKDVSSFPKSKELTLFVITNLWANHYFFSEVKKRIKKESFSACLLNQVQNFNHHIQLRLFFSLFCPPQPQQVSLKIILSGFFSMEALFYGIHFCAKKNLLRVLKKPAKKFFELTTLRNYAARSSEIVVYATTIILLYPLHRWGIESMNFSKGSIIEVAQQHYQKGDFDVYRNFRSDLFQMAAIAYLRL